MNNILEYLEENINIKKSDSFTQLQVWNNAAFDGEDLTMKTSWSSSDCTKENLSPTALNISSSTSSKPSSKHAKFKNQRNIDDEIAEIESEIRRLTSRLEALRLEKSDRKIASDKRVGGGGRVVAAKFMEPKRNAVVVVPNKVTEDTPIRNNAVVSNKVAENTPKRNAVVFKDVTPKRNVVVSKDDTPNNNKASRINWRRGMSLGPVEIAGRVPPAITPATQGRRKSCFWKPQEEIDEQRRKTICKANTVGAIKSVKKKEEEMVQPRNLFFKEAETEKSKSACVSNNNKKVLKQGRVVASRYNSGGVDVRKRSFPEKGGSEVRMKKRWEIPVEDVDVSGFVLLPKISTLRCVNESPRDSGAAKRVAELTGKKSYFCHDDEEEGSACQVLSFAEDDAE